MINFQTADDGRARARAVAIVRVEARRSLIVATSTFVLYAGIGEETT